jgi:hypothetical protein
LAARPDAGPSAGVPGRPGVVVRDFPGTSGGGFSGRDRR